MGGCNLIARVLACLLSTERADCVCVAVGLQVAAMMGDEMLVEEGALHAHNLLAPLLALRDRTPLLHAALAAIHSALVTVKELSACSSRIGQAGQRNAAAKVAGSISYHLVALSTGGGAGSSPGAAADALHEPHAGARFAQLQLSLLKACGPRDACASTAGVLNGSAADGQAPPAVAIEVAAAEDALLMCAAGASLALPPHVAER